MSTVSRSTLANKAAFTLATRQGFYPRASIERYSLEATNEIYAIHQVYKDIFSTDVRHVKQYTLEISITILRTISSSEEKIISAVKDEFKLLNRAHYKKDQTSTNTLLSLERAVLFQDLSFIQKICNEKVVQFSDLEKFHIKTHILLKAIESGSLAIVQQLCETLNVTGSQEHLKQAVVFGHTEIVEYFLNRIPHNQLQLYDDNNTLSYPTIVICKSIETISIKNQNTNARNFFIVRWAIQEQSSDDFKELIRAIETDTMERFLFYLRVITNFDQISSSPDNLAHPASIACILNRFRMLSILMDRQTISTEEKQYILNLASSLGHLEIVELIIRSPDILLSSIERALTSAAVYNRFEVFQFLSLRNEISPEYRIHCLKEAVKSPYLQVVQAFLSREDASMEVKKIALIKAVENNNLAIVQWLCMNQLFSLAEIREALALAFKHNRLEVILYLISIKDVASLEKKQEALHIASWQGDLLAIKYLLSLYDFSFQDKLNTLITAATYGHLPTVQYLLETEKFSLENKEKVLIEAITQKRLLIVRYLIETKTVSIKQITTALASPSRYPEITTLLKAALGNGEALLVLAVETGDIPLVPTADYIHAIQSIPYEIKHPLLELAVKLGHLNVLKLLIETNAISSEETNLLLTFSAQNGFIEALKLMMSSTAYSPIEKQNILYEAAASDQLEVVKLLTSLEEFTLDNN